MIVIPKKIEGNEITFTIEELGRYLDMVERDARTDGYNEGHEEGYNEGNNAECGYEYQGARACILASRYRNCRIPFH